MKLAWHKAGVMNLLSNVVIDGTFSNIALTLEAAQNEKKEIAMTFQRQVWNDRTSSCKQILSAGLFI